MFGREGVHLFWCVPGAFLEVAQWKRSPASACRCLQVFRVVDRVVATSLWAHHQLISLSCDVLLSEQAQVGGWDCWRILTRNLDGRLQIFGTFAAIHPSLGADIVNWSPHSESSNQGGRQEGRPFWRLRIISACSIWKVSLPGITGSVPSPWC